MVSFAIFIGAIIFIFAIFTPASEPSKKQYDMPKIKKIIMNNVSTDVGILFVTVSKTNACYDFNPKYYLKTNYLEINVSGEKRRYDIYFSDIFPLNVTFLRSSICPAKKFNLGSYHVENIVAEKRLKELNISYTADYNKLKNELGINYDFSFILMKLDNTILPELSAEKKTNARVEKISENIPIRVINNSGQIEERILNIRMW
ncbi:MAG: hypothetical protein Q8N99_00500 [Nanoarchaeota archaeon]|nr:hypothetical protein [Nanoarchaeota archaeon]